MRSLKITTITVAALLAFGTFASVGTASAAHPTKAATTKAAATKAAATKAAATKAAIARQAGLDKAAADAVAFANSPEGGRLQVIADAADRLVPKTPKTVTPEVKPSKANFCVVDVNGDFVSNPNPETACAL